MGAWLKLFLPLAALICGLFWLSARSEAGHAKAAFEARQQTQLRLAEDRFSEALLASATNLRVISATPALQHFVLGKPDGRELLAPLLAAFVGNDWTYDQLRVIDAAGREQVRVIRATEGPQVVPLAELQDKKDRDYITDTLAMPPGEVRVSRFDLNVEHGAIERPHRPVLRLSTRVSMPGAPDYLLVANLRGTVLLKTLQDLLDDAGTQTWLLDHEGYWVLHPDPSRRWGHQLDRTQQVQTLMPELAQRLPRAAGTLRTDDALYVFRRLRVGSEVVGTDRAIRSPTFDLVVRVPLEALPSPLRGERLMLVAVLLVLAALGCALVARVRVRADRAEQRAIQLLRDEAADGEARAWIREHSYQLSLKVHAARSPIEFAQLVLGELCPALGLTAACLYAVRDGHATGLASYGLQPGRALRDFESGEGLVGEALRTREERHLRPPPPGYLDVEGGLGGGVAAELRILPLWVHGRTVGVIELALSRPLEAREDEFLRSVLPLLAINLDGFLGRDHA